MTSLLRRLAVEVGLCGLRLSLHSPDDAVAMLGRRIDRVKLEGTGWLQTRYPNVDWLSHDAGHLLEMIFGWKANPHLGPFHILSNVLIVVGFLVIAAAWRVLYEAQRNGALATTGPYAYVRHPQYVGFILVMFGFLLQWPTLLTLAMFPVLVWMYVRLARSEEREAVAAFGDAYRQYAARVPGFIPSLAKPADVPKS